MWMRGATCTVCYDPENPWDAVIEDKSGKAEADDVVPGAPKRSMMKWMLVAVGILAAMSIVQFIIHAVLLMRR